jgi:ribonuclease HIII
MRIDTAVVLVLVSATRTLSLARNNLNHRPLRQKRSDPTHIERDLVDNRAYKYVIGSDESGRGCLAGPVVTASCCITEDLATYVPIEGVDDSKLLSKEQRQRIYDQVMNHPKVYRWTIATRTNEDIDATSVQQATLDGFYETIESLADQISPLVDDKQDVFYR